MFRALASARGSVATRRVAEGPKGPRTKGTATRGPERGQNIRVRGPEDEQRPVPVLALASATICFSRFSQKSRFSWHYLGPLMTAKMLENFDRVSCLQYKHRVKKSKQFVDQIKSYARLKFRKNAVFVSIWVTTYNIPTRISLSRERGHNFAKSHTYLEEHNLSSLIDINLIKTAIDRYSLDLSTHVL